MTIHWGYLIVAFFLSCFGLCKWVADHAPYGEENLRDGFYRTDENGKRLK